MLLLYNNAALPGTVFCLCQKLSVLLRDFHGLICTVFHNICHRIQLLRNNLAVFQQPVIPCQVQPRLFKNAHPFLYYGIGIRAVLFHLHDNFMVRLPRPLQRLQHISQIRIHRAFGTLPAQSALIAVDAQAARQLVLNPSYLFG